jgi:hypothetical protein
MQGQSVLSSYRPNYQLINGMLAQKQMNLSVDVDNIQLQKKDQVIYLMCVKFFFRGEVAIAPEACGVLLCVLFHHALVFTA